MQILIECDMGTIPKTLAGLIKLCMYDVSYVEFAYLNIYLMHIVSVV